MFIPPKNSRMRQLRVSTDEDHERFIERHRPILLRYLDGMPGRSVKGRDALRYIESVLAEWHAGFSRSELTAPSPEERTFWFALYQLEELVEFPTASIDPYQKILMENLITVRELLRNRQPLTAHVFMATRPDGS